ncbi:MAG: GEVED domain-containing protein, partial [Fluviicola sp.]|nr:GEVED domain-containing protein [Fluviicola sp.]
MRTVLLLFLFCSVASTLFSQCASNATSTADEDIFNVTFGTLNNSSTCGTTGGAGSSLNLYSNYTGVSAPNVAQCASVAFSVQIGTCGGNYSNAVAIFIDWNADLDWADAGETVYVSAASTSGPHTETGFINIPAGASLGNKRMRVVNVETGTPSSITACGTYTWGETEDYLINVTSGGALTYTSCTTTQIISGLVPKCASNRQIIGVQVVMGAGCSANLTQFQLGAGASTNLVTDVSRIRIYYTGTSNMFATTNEFVIGGTIPVGAANTINGSQGLVSGTNYFWIAYDMNPAALTGNLIDGSCTQLTIAAVNRIPTTTNPAGNGTISLCQGPGGVSTGLETWLRADIGVTGVTPITAWTNQQTSGTAVIVNGSPNLNNTATSYNYNPYVDFIAPVGTLANGLAANRQFLRFSGYTGISALNFTTLFYAFQLTDLTRVDTHIGTVDGITYSAGPANGTLHGFNFGGSAAIHTSGYDLDFGAGSPANTWQRNGINIAHDANHSSTKHILSANCQTGGNTGLNTLLGGQIDDGSLTFLGHFRDWRGPVAEIIGFSTAITATERQRIDSYIATKYGITLTANYLSTSGSTIFTTAAPYNNNIIGIGRDDAEAMTQKQSHNNDDLVRIYLNSLAATNAANAGSFASDISYVMTGATTGSMCATAASNAEMP